MKTRIRYRVDIARFTVLLMLLAGHSMAGDLDPTNAPGPTMHTLEEIYQKVSWISTDVVSVVISTNITQMFFDAGVPKTGQTNSYATADDGDLEKGVMWPIPRFTDNLDGTVTDHLTGLIWLKNASAFGTQLWTNAVEVCNALNAGESGLTDGSAEGDWRLPNIRELLSLIDFGQSIPPIPSGHPFTGVQNFYYWSSSTITRLPYLAWSMGTTDGEMNRYDKSTQLNYVWPVRDKQ